MSTDKFLEGKFEHKEKRIRADWSSDIKREMKKIKADKIKNM